MKTKPERVEIKLVRHFKKNGISGHFEQDIYSILRMSTGDWEKDRLRYIKGLNKLQEDLNAEEEKEKDSKSINV